MEYIADFIIILAFLSAIYVLKWRHMPNNKVRRRWLFCLYIVVVLYVTVMPFGIYKGYINSSCLETVNLVPFRDVVMHYGDAVKEALLNVIMFIPFGLFYPMAYRKHFFKTILVAFCFSLAIEFYQLVGVWFCFEHTRTFDVTDLINNTIGSAIGFGLFAIVQRALNKL